MGRKKSLILAFDTCIGEGSVAVLCGQDITVSAGSGLTRAADALYAIESTLKRSNSTTQDLGRIAVALGPGSFTGIRIGISTALGLGRGTVTTVVGVPILKALAWTTKLNDVAAVVPIGRGRSAIQRFINLPERTIENPAKVVSDATLIKEMQTNPGLEFVLSSGFSEQIASSLLAAETGNLRFENLPIAVAIARYVASGGTGSLEPIYL